MLSLYGLRLLAQGFLVVHTFFTSIVYVSVRSISLERTGQDRSFLFCVWVLVALIRLYPCYSDLLPQTNVYA